MKKERDTSRDYVEIVEVPKDIKIKYNYLGLDRGLKIVLYGPPFTDSRPRTNKFTKAVAMINLNKMKKVFSKLYDKSDILQNTVILSPYVIVLHAYKEPTQKVRRMIKKTWGKRIQKMFTDENLHDMSINDVDNMVKIHNDILFADEYRICIDDAWNIIDTNCQKIISSTPRAELYVYYTSKPNAYYQYHIETSSKYYKYLISQKDQKINKRDTKAQLKHLKKVFNEWLARKSKSDYKSFIKSTKKVLEEYSAVDIKELASMTEHTFTKADAQNKILLTLVGADVFLKEIVSEIIKEDETIDNTECEGLYDFY